MTDNGAPERRGRRTPSEPTLRMRRELSQGSGAALTSAFELALTPALFAFLGWRLDQFFGSGPFLLLLFFLFVLGYEFWKLHASYVAQMDEQERKLLGGGDE